jgi:RNA polymerase sigma factor (sigma-70 family)
MPNGLTARTAGQVARVFRDGTLAGMSDRQVLERFIEHRDETAFEAILHRHGAMVRNVCRQMLFDPHDVDDAVQSVFLVLVRKAKFIRVDGSLGPWLYAVAGRVAARARASRRKRFAREWQSGEMPETSYSATEDAFEIPAVIHDELGRLPERLRAPLVLCYLEGLTHDLAARQLDCPVGTVRSRLARARSLLHRLIMRRGITLSAAALGGMLESSARAAAVARLPDSLYAAITHAMVETARHSGLNHFTSLTTILGGVLNVSKIKKIAALAGCLTVGALSYAMVERTKLFGQTPGPVMQLSGIHDTRRLGPDGRPIGSLALVSANGAFAKTYYVGDLVQAEPPDRAAVGAGSTLPGQRMFDVAPIVDLIETTIVPGTWVIQDGRGNELPPQVIPQGATATTRQNAMVPFFLSVSLIIKCPREVHDDIARLLRNLRRLKYPLEEQSSGERRITVPVPDTALARPPLSPPSSNDRKKKIDELMKSLQEEIGKLDDGEGAER